MRYKSVSVLIVGFLGFCRIILLVALSLFNLSSPRLAKTVSFVILLCLMPDDFTRQWRPSGVGKS